MEINGDVSGENDYSFNSHGTRWQCTVETFIIASLDAYKDALNPT